MIYLHDALDQERVVAAVAELHRDVIERGARAGYVGTAEEKRAVLTRYSRDIAEI